MVHMIEIVAMIEMIEMIVVILGRLARDTLRGGPRWGGVRGVRGDLNFWFMQQFEHFWA